MPFPHRSSRELNSYSHVEQSIISQQRDGANRCRKVDGKSTLLHTWIPPNLKAIQLINKVCGKDEVEVGYGLQSCTEKVKVTSPISLDNREVYLIDTPGFDDTTKDEADILTSIAQFFAAA